MVHTGTDPSVRKLGRTSETNPNLQCQLVWGADAAAHRGVALAISNRLGATSVETVYQDTGTGEHTGRTLIVNLTIHETTKLTVILSYAPSGGRDQDREDYFRRITRYLPHGDGSRRVIWMGDFNFVECPHLDADGTQGPAGGTGGPARREMLDAFARACGVLSGPHGGGMHDAYRTVHPEGRETTHEKGRRLDRIYVSGDLLYGMPGIVAAGHIHRTDLQVLGGVGGGKGKILTSDHDAVYVTVRITDTPVAKPPWTFQRDRYTDAQLDYVEAILASNLTIGNVAADAWANGDSGASLSLRVVSESDGFQAWQTPVRAYLKRCDRESIRARHAERNACTRRQRNLEWALRSAQRGARAGAPQVTSLTAQLVKIRRRIERIDAQHQTQAARRRQREYRWRENGCSKELFGGAAPPRAMELPITRLERVDDQHTTTEVSGQDEIAETFLDHWRRLFNLPALAPSAETDARDILAVIRDDPARQLAPEMAARLDVAALISVGSIEAAIDAMKTDTAPGADGFPPRFYKDRRWRRRLAERLHRLYAQIVRDGEMTEAMRESVISILYKGKGKNRRRCKSYRPVSIAALERRILGKAIELQLRLAVPSVLSGSNLGFIPGERIEDDALLTAAAAAHCDASGRGGAMLYLDNVAAYDRVRIAFLIETLRAFGFPDEFTSLIETMHRGRTARLKVNGHVGQSFALNNGLTQGAPESCMLFLLVQEVLLRMIATDPMLRGVSIPGRDEGSPIELRERSFADDTKVFLETASQAPRLAATIRQYERVSGQWLDMSEAVGVLFGADKKITLPADNFGVKAWRCFGEDELERCLGVVLGSPAQVTAQWEAKVAEVRSARVTKANIET